MVLVILLLLSKGNGAQKRIGDHKKIFFINIMGEIIIFFFTDLVSCSYYVFSSYITEVILFFFFL